MILKSLKIASQSGQKQAGIFRRLADRFAQSVKGKPESIASKGDVYDGFIIKHSLVGGRITTRVIDTEGFLLGFTDPNGETPGALTNPDYLWPTFERDVFSPFLGIPEDLAPKNYASVTVTATASVYGGTAITQGTPFTPTYRFTTGNLNTEGGMGVSAVLCSLSNPSTTYSPGPMSQLWLFNNIIIDGHYNYAKISMSAKFSVNYRLIIGKRSTPKNANIISIEINEDEIDAVMPGYKLVPRLYPFGASLVRGYYGFHPESWTSIRIIPQIPIPTSARDGSRCVGVTTVTTSPERTNFEYACGTTGILVSLITYVNDSLSLDHISLPANSILPDGVEVEPWSDEVPWIQEFTATGDITSSIINPTTVSFTVVNPVGGTYLYDFDVNRSVFGNTVDPIPFADYMPNNLGKPHVAMKSDSFDIYIDYRITRSWVDPRTSNDRYDDLHGVTMQTQTGIVCVTIPYEITVDGEGVESYAIGAPSSSPIIADVSGAVTNTMAGLGGDREDFHRLYRVRWAGMVGDKSVCIASVVKHLRWETPPTFTEWEYTPQGRNLQTAQSSINYFHQVLVRFTFLYQEDGDPLPEEQGGRTRWTHYKCTAIVGDGDPIYDSTTPNDGSWRESVGVTIFVDGVPTELDSVTTGWRLIRDISIESLRADDTIWDIETAKLACAISANEFVVCGYRMDDTGVDLIKINVDTMAMEVLRSDTYPSSTSRPAVHCYQLGSEDTPACITYRLGAQTSIGGFIDLSKDGGETWTRIAQGGTPAMGATYVGSSIWAPEHGNIFG